MYTCIHGTPPPVIHRFAGFLGGESARIIICLIYIFASVMHIHFLQLLCIEPCCIQSNIKIKGVNGKPCETHGRLDLTGSG